MLLFPKQQTGYTGTPEFGIEIINQAVKVEFAVVSFFRNSRLDQAKYVF